MKKLLFSFILVVIFAGICFGQEIPVLTKKDVQYLLPSSQDDLEKVNNFGFIATPPNFINGVRFEDDTSMLTRLRGSQPKAVESYSQLGSLNDLIYINFDEMSGGYYPFSKQRYASQGVVFSTIYGGDPWVWANIWYPYSVVNNPNWGTYSLFNALTGNYESTISVVADFVVPETGQSGVTNFVSVCALSGPGPDPLSPNSALLAYDFNGKLIAAHYANTSLQYQFLSVNASGIAKVVMVAGPLREIFDEFTFRKPTPLVEVETITAIPGTLWLDKGGVGSGIVFRATTSEATTVNFKIRAPDGTETSIGAKETHQNGSEHVAKLSWWGKPGLPEGQYTIVAEAWGSRKTAEFAVKKVAVAVTGYGKWLKTKDAGAIVPELDFPFECPAIPWEEVPEYKNGNLTGIAVSDPVEITLGNYVYSDVDLALKSRDGLTLARIYNSLDPHAGGFGIGWSSPYFSRLEFIEGNVVFVNSDGGRILFQGANGVYSGPSESDLRLNFSADTGFWTLSHPYGTEWSFDQSGKLIRMAKACCGRGAADGVLLDYDSAGRLHRVTNSAGQWLEFNWGPNEFITGVADSTGRTVQYEIDAIGQLISVTNAAGQITAYAYNEDQFLSEIRKPGNRTTTIAYVDRRVSSVTEPNGEISSFVWDYQAPKLSLTNPQGVVHEYLFTPEWKLTTYQVPALNLRKEFSFAGLALTTYKNSLGAQTAFRYGALGLIDQKMDPLGNLTQYEYHQTFHRLTKKTDSLGRIWEYTWCPRGNLWSETDPAGGITSFTYDANNNRTSKTDPLGRVTRYVYDSTGNWLLQTVDAMGGISSFTYDLRGNMLTSTDALGRTTVYQYDLLDRLVKTTYPDGRYTQVIYDEAGNIASRKDNLNRTTAYTYDAAGRMLTTTRPDGSVLSHAYDASGRKISSTDALGRVTGYEYDALDNLVKVTYPDQSCQTYVYDTEKRLISSSDELGNVTAYEYDPMGRMLATIDPAGARYESTYDVAGRKVAARDPLGRTTTWAYDVLDRVTKTTAPDQTFSLSSYDAVGNLLISTNALNQQTVYEYDALNRQIKTTRPGGAQFVTAYDAAGQVVSETDALGNKNSYSYDVGGRRVATTRADGKQFTSVYDNAGRLIKTIDPLNASSTVSYDIMDRAVAETDALGRTSRYEYDAGGKRIAKIDPMGRRSLYGYDTRDQLTTEVDAEGRMVSHAYDAAGRKTGLTDGAGRIWRWVYDAVGRVVAEIDPLGYEVKSSYDLAGNPVLKTNARNQATGYEYDLMNRLVKVYYPDATAATFSYDALGRELARSGAAGAVEKSYDLAGNLVSEKFINHNKAWNYSFDLMGNRIQAISPENETFRYVYDRLYRLITLETGKASEKVTYAYDALGRNIETVRADSTTINRFDAAGQLLEMKHYRLVLDKDCGKHKKGKKNEPAYKEEILALRQYSYDLAGNRVSMTDEDGKVTVYAYDASNWLKQVDYPGNQRVSYTYNDAGDRISEQTGSNPAVQYAYDAAGRMIGRGSESFSYDADGNMLTDAVATYTWNSDNRLVRVEKTLDACKHDKYRHGFGYGHLKHGKETTLYEEYSYLPEDWRRVSRKSGKYELHSRNRGFCRDNEEETIVSVYDGDDESQEYQLSISKTGHRNKKETLRLNLLREFIGGPVADDLEHTRYNRLSLAMLKDGLGSTIAITGREAKVLADIDYDAWGNFRNQGKDIDLPCRHEDFDDYLDRFENTRGFGCASHNRKTFGKYFADRLTPYLYTGRRYSNFTSQYFNRNRYYSPALGRFTTKDPIGFEGGSNLFAYANQNPLLYTDPNGEFALTAPALIAFLATPEGAALTAATIAALWNAVNSTRKKNEQCDAPQIPFPETGNPDPDFDPDDNEGSKTNPSNPGKMNQEVARGQAPKGVERVDPPHYPGGEPHVHYTNGSSSTVSGQPGHAGRGAPQITNAIKNWLQSHGWQVPK